jgi:hypothetical protein
MAALRPNAFAFRCAPARARQLQGAVRLSPKAEGTVQMDASGHSVARPVRATPLEGWLDRGERKQLGSRDVRLQPAHGKRRGRTWASRADPDTREYTFFLVNTGLPLCRTDSPLWCATTLSQPRSDRTGAAAHSATA